MSPPSLSSNAALLSSDAPGDGEETSEVDVSSDTVASSSSGCFSGSDPCIAADADLGSHAETLRTECLCTSGKMLSGPYVASVSVKDATGQAQEASRGRIQRSTEASRR